jgi:hypothetical protein
MPLFFLRSSRHVFSVLVPCYCWRNKAAQLYGGNEILGFVFVGEQPCGVKQSWGKIRTAVFCMVENLEGASLGEITENGRAFSIGLCFFGEPKKKLVLLFSFWRFFIVRLLLFPI